MSSLLVYSLPLTHEVWEMPCAGCLVHRDRNTKTLLWDLRPVQERPEIHSYWLSQWKVAGRVGAGAEPATAGAWATHLRGCSHRAWGMIWQPL